MVGAFKTFPLKCMAISDSSKGGLRNATSRLRSPLRSARQLIIFIATPALPTKRPTSNILQFILPPTETKILLSAIKNWARFRIDALGLVTIGGSRRWIAKWPLSFAAKRPRFVYYSPARTGAVIQR
jgi:hypothetical protein